MPSTSCSTPSCSPSNARWGPNTRRPSCAPSATADPPADPRGGHPAGNGPALDGMASLAGRLIAVVGPTASGKSLLALRLARVTGAEIVSCDSLQVYRGLDIGSAKATPEERREVPHHLVDVADPDHEFSAALY